MPVKLFLRIDNDSTELRIKWTHKRQLRMRNILNTQLLWASIRTSLRLRFNFRDAFNAQWFFAWSPTSN